MGLWRIKWAAKQLFSLKNFKNQCQTLTHARHYYHALFSKMPAQHSKPLILQLRTGQKVPVVEFMSLYIYQEIFVQACYDIEIKNKNPVIIDVGANTGLFSLRMKALYPDSQIFCFEPYPPNFQQLQYTIELNQLQNIQPQMAAVAENAGKIKLYIHPRNIGGHSIYQQEAGNYFVEVNSVPLASVFDQQSIDHCDLLKLDCEGAEYEIIQSISPELAQKIDTLVYEATPSCYNVSELNQYLTNLGYCVSKRRGLYWAKQTSKE